MRTNLFRRVGEQNNNGGSKQIGGGEHNGSVDHNSGDKHNGGSDGYSEKKRIGEEMDGFHLEKKEMSSQEQGYMKVP
ncbi:putative tRNA N6-adenosine threonylcarbamoyltransferase [Cucumis melo var. makuwa]|uniref:Putative tRNA N6-adenosine threonylcarbamoyltransferase n=1 Tax=Cucumis melo var. makuwa TaxID=1194695 RepID=A0A5D3DBJ7_CUCMM|nr:putative tRNA N6-adenosine threonylcarbamoyltransferase [Cucumis melo var. makuwa]